MGTGWPAHFNDVTNLNALERVHFAPMVIANEIADTSVSIDIIVE